jgi:hypothetical protein
MEVRDEQDRLVKFGVQAPWTSPIDFCLFACPGDSFGAVSEWGNALRGGGSTVIPHNAYGRVNVSFIYSFIHIYAAVSKRARCEEPGVQ